jgi:hypothetical protein
MQVVSVSGPSKSGPRRQRGARACPRVVAETGVRLLARAARAHLGSSSRAATPRSAFDCVHTSRSASPVLMHSTRPGHAHHRRVRCAPTSGRVPGGISWVSESPGPTFRLGRMPQNRARIPHVILARDRPSEASPGAALRQGHARIRRSDRRTAGRASRDSSPPSGSRLRLRRLETTIPGENGAQSRLAPSPKGLSRRRGEDLEAGRLGRMPPLRIDICRLEIPRQGERRRAASLSGATFSGRNGKGAPPT